MARRVELMRHWSWLKALGLCLAVCPRGNSSVLAVGFLMGIPKELGLGDAVGGGGAIRSG